MNRRTFLTATGAAGAVPLQAMAGSSTPAQEDEREFFELLIYHTHVGSRRSRVADFYRDVALPAYERLGIGPVGVFSMVYGPTQPSLYVLVPHKSLDSVVNTPARLLADANVQEAGADFLNASLSDPAYVRFERRLMRAFADMPRLEAPTELGGQERIFEIRVYESHSRTSGQKKIDMFNEGGEIPIFHKTGLTPVFFGETLFGPDMPNLTYMLVFDNLTSRDEAWSKFFDHPDWLKLRDDPTYKDTVSNITDIILRPTPFSQI